MEPVSVWGIFEEITKVPRPSKKEEKIRAYIKDFATAHKLQYKEDEAGNILVSRPATPGCGNAPAVTLQAHMDMVCDKVEGVKIDFDKDPLKPYIDGDWVTAEGTTLGADNGIGIAAALALLTEKELPTGPVEALFTVDEETGLGGAKALKDGFISGKYLINLDSEEEGEIFIGCAGGADTTATFVHNPMMSPPNYHFMKISVSGLKGGHSGGDIHLGRGNAIKILSRFLCPAMDKYNMVLASFEGGSLRNAIPREASAVIGVPADNRERITVELNMYAATVREELQGVDEDFTMQWESVEPCKVAMDRQTSFVLLNTLNACPHGVISMSAEMKGLVETSTNLASVKKSGENRIIVSTSQRSSVDSMKEAIVGSVESLFMLAGAKVSHGDAYPGWRPDRKSELLKIAVDAYKESFNDKKPQVKAIHAGLECALFLKKYPSLDMISIGPTMADVHTPDERMHIPSVERFYTFLKAILVKVAEQ